MPADAGRRKIKIGVIGASGYTGADLIRLAARHPFMELTLLAANTHAGKALSDVFPHLGFVRAPPLVKAEDADWSTCDAVFCGLPHGTAQDIIATLPESVRNHRHVGRFPPQGYRHLRQMVRASACRPSSRPAGGLRADRVLPPANRSGANSLPAPDAIQRQRCSRSCRSSARSSSTPRTSLSTQSRACPERAARLSRTSCSRKPERGSPRTVSAVTGMLRRSSRKSQRPREKPSL